MTFLEMLVEIISVFELRSRSGGSERSEDPTDLDPNPDGNSSGSLVPLASQAKLAACRLESGAPNCVGGGTSRLQPNG